MDDRHPQPGELWEVAGPYRHAVLHDRACWSVMDLSAGEWTLNHVPVTALTPTRFLDTPGPGWTAHFDALAAAAGMDLTWVGYVARLRDQALSALGAVQPARG